MSSLALWAAGPPGRVLKALAARRALLIPVALLNGLLFLVPAFMLLQNAATADAWETLFANETLGRVARSTLIISALSTLLTIVLAYVCALAIWRAGPMLRAVLIALVLLPFWTGIIVKNFAWAVMLQDNGIVNDLLQSIGLASDTVTLLHTRFAVVVGMVHYLLPYAVLPILAGMLAIDRRLSQAALSLGASVWQTMRHVVVPLTLPGVMAAALLVFIISVGFFITPVVLGGPGDRMVANLVEMYTRELADFGAASALAMMVSIVVASLVIIYQRLPKEGQHGII